MLEPEIMKVLVSVAPAPEIARLYWQEIVQAHSQPARHYHNLEHLQAIWQQLQPVRDEILDWPIMLCAIAYHDFIYNTLHSDNEENSAAFAVEKLSALHFSRERIEQCRRHILATKKHEAVSETDTNYFTDADLSILGADPTIYMQYAENIRQEYESYPDMIYKPGRYRVLESFLQRPRLFKTDHFYGLYEEKARINLLAEMKQLDIDRPGSF